MAKKKRLPEGKKKSPQERLADMTIPDYCGPMTVREFASVVMNDKLNFPKGLDTPLSIGDFEGNCWTDVLSITKGGERDDHVCLAGGL